MGQYYKVCNLDKKEFLNPHAFDDGAKLMEFGASSEGTMTALALLLADGNGRGGGDFPTTTDNGIVGRWAGDRIIIAGDYADGFAGRFGIDDPRNFYKQTLDWKDMSPSVANMLRLQKS